MSKIVELTELTATADDDLLVIHDTDAGSGGTDKKIQVSNLLKGKVDKEAGKGLSSNDFTDGEKSKLAGLENYDDTALSDRVSANETAIGTLNGTGEGSVKKTVADEIARVVDDAPADLDTLKEISDWISGHADDASAMNAQIQANKGAIETLNGSDTTAGSVAKQVKDASDGLQSQIDTNASDIADNATAIATETTNRTNADNNILLQLNTLKGVAMTMYASESLLPASIDFENGVVVAVGEIAWCVAEKTWHRVSAVNAETLAITWSDYDPHIQADIDLSKYSKNLIIDKAENITDAQKEEYDTFDTTDNECGMVFGEVAEGDHNAVDGDTVYSALASSIVAETVTVNVPANSSGATISIGKSGYRPIAATVVYVSYVVPAYCFLETDANLTVKTQEAVASTTPIKVRIVWQKN